jgi:uncharacterized protein (AIM24 family)
MEATGQRVECQWCRAQNPVGATSCATCGAPLDVRNLVSDSGWREAPRLRDMTEIHFGASTCQVEGELVPVAEMALDPQDGIYFEHHVMLWKEETVPISVMSLPGMMKRTFAGMPHIISVARGPGRIAFSRDQNGELVVLPMAPGVEVDVREHAFLLASHSVGYSYTRIQGLRTALFAGTGMFMDRFVAQQQGLLILHGYGNVFERQLAAGQSILLEPGAYLYKDASVQMAVETQKLTSGLFGGQGMHLVRMSGPGRVGIQSMYVHHQTE